MARYVEFSKRSIGENNGEKTNGIVHNENNESRDEGENV
jgi:hypothetical protein